VSPRRAKPPVLETAYGPVPEWARLQAAINMRNDPALRDTAIRMLAVQLRCGVADAMKEHRRRYPESWEGEPCVTQ